MKSNSITYDVFLDAIGQLESLGEKITVRSIVDKIGGSFTKIAEFKRQWQQNQELARKATLKMSSQLETAIYAEFSRLHAGAQTTYKLQLEQAENDNQELLVLIHKLENQNTQLQQALSDAARDNTTLLLANTLIANEKSTLFFRQVDLEKTAQEKNLEFSKVSDQNKQLMQEISNLEKNLERQTNRCLQIESLYQKTTLEVNSLKGKLLSIEKKSNSARYPTKQK